MYVVAIPTFNRADVISRKTLNTLSKGGIDSNNIYLFVANAQQKLLYKDIHPNIIIGKLGITAQRNFIRNHFNVGQHVVEIDDDVEGLYKLHHDKLILIKDIHSFFIKAFNLIVKEHRFMWGIYPVRNPFFMKHSVSNGLAFIIGALHGFIVRHDSSIQPHSLAEGKEDYEQSILYFLKDGGVIRFNNVTIKTKFLAKGGLGQDRFKRNMLSAKFLHKTYPHLVSIFHRKNGMTEIRLRRTLKT